MARRHRFATCVIVLAAGVLCSYGGGSLPAPPASANKSTIGCPSGNQPCSGSVHVPQILVNGTDPATYGLPMSCSLTSGSLTMDFVTVPSQPWFGSSPGNGTLQPNRTTTISVTAMNAANVSNRNIGSLTVSASKYSDNNQMQVELNCNVVAGTCTVAFSCDVSKHRLP